MKRDLVNMQKFDPAAIREHVAFSWYEGTESRKPSKGVTKPKYTKLGDKNRYSWMKAPRYNNKATETGPLATVLTAYAKGQPECKALVDTVLKHLDVGPEALFSTLGRTAARGIECAVIAAKTETWLNQLEANVKKGDTKLYEEWKMPKEAEGVGFVTAPRGGLSHWISIRNGKSIIFSWWSPPPGTWGPAAPPESWDRWKRP